MTTLLILSIDHSIMYENDYLNDTSIRQLALYETAILLTFVNRHWSKHLIDRLTDTSIVS